MAGGQGKRQMKTGITHFTSQQAAAAILDGWRRDLTRGSSPTSMGPPEVKVRLYSRWGTNDPLDQKMAASGTDTTEKKHSKGAQRRFRITFPDDVFMLCGSKPQTGDKGEATDRLEMWRAYGDNGRGVALTTWWDVAQLETDRLEIVEVKYQTDMSSVTEEMDELIAAQKDQGKSSGEREKIRRKRMTLGASNKLRDYESEQEVRLVYFQGDESGAVGQELNIEAPNGRLRTYIERPVRLGASLIGLDITLGPRMLEPDIGHWEKVGQWMLGQMCLSRGKVRRSKLEYLG